MNNFFKNVITLMTGTLMGQLLIILTLPVITRLYSPEQFGEYSNMVAIISILGVITTLRYDIAMAITDKREERNNLLYLSLILNLVISIFILIVLSLLSMFFKAFSIVEITYIFISTFVLGLVQIFTSYNSSLGNFKKISFTKFSQSLIQVLVQLMGILTKNNMVFLFLGYLLGRSNGLFILYKSGEKSIKWNEFSVNKIRMLSKKYKNYPFYGLPSSLLNAFSSNIIVILTLFIFGGYYAGIYGFIIRMTSAPLQLISKSYNNALFKLAHENNINQFKKVYFITSTSIFSLFLIVIVVYFNIEINLFQIVFGDQWKGVNEVFMPLLILTAFQYSIIPVTELLTILNKQKLRLFWDIIKIILIVGLFIYTFYNNVPFKIFIYIFSVISIVLYIILHTMIIKVLNNANDKTIKEN